MKKPSEISQVLPFYLFVSGIFLLIVFKDLLSNGMFLDGLIYSTVSKNLAHGIGTFWNPHFTDTCMPEFHEHPPLALGIQSIFFTIFGDSRYIDKLYSICTVIFVGYILMKIWNTLGYKNGWFTLFLWIVTPTVFWASYNCLLENSLTIFTSLSILFYLKYEKNKKFFFIMLSGLMLSLGFLTKGFVVFFPLTFPFLLWLFMRHKSFGKMVIDSAGIFIFSIVPLGLLVLFSHDARLSLISYIDHQVVGSLRSSVTVNSRFDILLRLLTEIAPAWLLCILFLVWSQIRKFQVIVPKENTRKALVFGFLGLTGVLPLLISMKQSGFYIIAVYPLFAISAGLIMNPLVESLVSKINYQSRGFLFFRWLSFGLFSLGITLSVCCSSGFSRDKTMIKDAYTIVSEIPEGTVININPDMNTNWSLHAYFYRFKNISLDSDLKNKREYLLINNNYYSDTLNLNYKIVKLNTVDYQLFKKQLKEK